MFSIYEAKDAEEMLNMFRKTIYARKLKEIDSEIVEKNVYQIRYYSARASLLNAQDAPVALYSFMFLCEMEVNNLTSIIEGIRYKASPAFIEKLLII